MTTHTDGFSRFRTLCPTVCKLLNTRAAAFWAHCFESSAVARTIVSSCENDPAAARCSLDAEECERLADAVADALATWRTTPAPPPWLADLVRVEGALAAARHEVDATPRRFPPAAGFVVAPGVRVTPTGWAGLPALLRGEGVQPTADQGHVLIYASNEVDEASSAASTTLRCEQAAREDLLALKVAAESLPLEAVARQLAAESPDDPDAEPAALAALRALMRAAAAKGLLIPPASQLQRAPAFSNVTPAAMLPAEAGLSETFVIQWHITQRCDLHCKHCYDRSPREDAPWEAGLVLLDDLAAFCFERSVRGQVTFTGGNPLLHPRFEDFARAATARGLGVAVLGNPCTEAQLDRLLAIVTPVMYQISLEGLEAHNDCIRGAGHFQRSLAFLDIAKTRGLRTQVMLTLTRENQEQVIPLAERLAGRVETFTFNRLAPVGEGAQLACADTAGYADFLQRYLEAAERSPHMSLKENLFNATLAAQDRAGFGGCTGHGCGAAFNFIAVLGDGQAHACRKMVSPIGDVYAKGLAAVYDGEAAQGYRRGSTACAACALKAACGGCLAVTRGLGLDPFNDRDPYCFYANAPASPVNRNS